jgi:hypothetical protein
MNPEPGTVQLQGLYEGPTSSWAPQQELVADALRRAGAPENCLHALIHGGRGSLEPEPILFPRGQFADAPADCLALALELMLEETLGGKPEEWFSTLRVIEYQERVQIESLIQVNEDGIRGISREQPWTPVPKKSLQDRIWANKLVLSLAVLAFLVYGFFNRHKVGEWVHAFETRFFAEDFAIAEELQQELGGFGTYLYAETELDEELNQLVVTLRQTNAYPHTPSDFDVARAQADRKEGIALAALELGKATLILHFQDGDVHRKTVSLIDWEDDGSLRVDFATTPWRGSTLTLMEMES